jgi:hypothetical protein
MITHGHGDEAFVQYSNELWPNEPNFTIGFILRLLWTLKKEHVRELQRLFDNELQNGFFEQLMWRSSWCLKALKAPKQVIGVKPLPKKLLFQMDNRVNDNKSQHLLVILSLLTTKEVFEDVQ